MKSLLLFPFNGNARESIAVIEAINKQKQEWNAIGFVDDDLDTLDRSFANCRVIGNRDAFKRFESAFILAVPGRPENFHKRQRIIESLHVHSERFATLIHPSSAIGPGVSIGKNVLIMAHVTLTAGVNIGNHVVILPGTVVSHDSVIEDFSMVGSNVVIAGGVTVERVSYIGSGSSVKQGITIGAGALVGMGSVVIRNVISGSTVAGCPANQIERIDR